MAGITRKYKGRTSRTIICVMKVIIGAVVSCALGCSSPPPLMLERTEIILSDIPVERTELGHQWRNVQHLPSGGPVIFDLSKEPDTNILRLGIFTEAAQETSRPLSFAVELDDKIIAENTYKTPGSWQDFRIELDASAAETNPSCRISFNSEQPFYLSPIELIKEKGSSVPNVMIFLVDTLRRDHLACYGYEKPTSNFIDAFARDSVLMGNLSAQTCWTKPSVCSLFSSKYPPYHGAQTPFDMFSSTDPTLADVLNEAGYETFSFINNPHLLPMWNICTEFDRTLDLCSGKSINKLDDKDVINSAIGSLESVLDKPWFFYVHTMSPHWPYAPVKEYPGITEEDMLPDGVICDINGNLNETTGKQANGWDAIIVNGSLSWVSAEQKTPDNGYLLMTTASGENTDNLLFVSSKPFSVKEGDLVTFSGDTSAYGRVGNSCLTIGLQAYVSGHWKTVPSRAWAWGRKEMELLEGSSVIPAGATKARLCVYVPQPQIENSGWFVDNLEATVYSLDDPSTAESVSRQLQINRYDHEIAYVDEQFGRLLEALKAEGLYDNTLIVFTSDHGEEFWDHGGTGHSSTLYEELLQLPCIVKLPDQQNAGASQGGLVETIDIAPTILDYLNIPVEPAFQGSSFLKTLVKGQAPEKEYSASMFTMKEKNMAAIRSNRHKFIDDYAESKEIFYDLISDPQEKTPTLEPKETLAQMKNKLAEIMAPASSGLHIYIEFDKETKEYLTGALRGENIGKMDIRASGYPMEFEQSQNEVKFNIKRENVSQKPSDKHAFFGNPINRNHVEIFIVAPPTLQIELELKRNTEIIPQEQVFAGEKLQNIGIDGVKLDLSELTSASPDVKAKITTGKFGVYLWHNPPIASVIAENVDAETQDALRALGYL